MPTAKKSDKSPQPGERVRVYVDGSMIDEPAEIIREDRGAIVLHVWPDSEARVAMRARWFPTEGEATAHGYGAAWPDDH